MKFQLRTLIVTAAVVTAGAVWANAQITDQIHAHVNHSFMIGDKTLPPGDYTFRMENNSDLGIMIAENQKGDNVAQFNVRQSTDNHRPKHSELVFRKFGNAEFLSKIYESGSNAGVALTETGKQESRLVSAGQQGVEHTEEQP